MSHQLATKPKSRSGPKALPCTVQMGARGRLVLPARVRRQLGLEQGSKLILTTEEPGVLKLTSSRAAAASCMGLLQSLAGERSLSDELIAERREAARRE